METTWNLRPHFNDQLVPHFGNEILTMVPEDTQSHFEYFESNNADALTELANSNPYSGAALQLVNIGKGIFGKHDDKSDTGFQQFKASGGGALPFYPTKAEMLKAAQSPGWDKAEPAAISASYNPNDGTWKRGDWNFKTVSTSPIAAKAFKGAKEGFSMTSSVNAAIPAGIAGAPSQASPVAGGTPSQVVTTPTGNVAPQQIQTAVQQLKAQGATDEQAHDAVGNALGVPKDIVKKHAKNAGGGGNGGGSVMGGLSIPIILVGVAVIGLIIYLVARK